MDALYLGARPTEKLSRLLAPSGLRVAHAKYKPGSLASSSAYCAVVLHWKSKTDQRVIVEAKSLGIPVLVITSKLAEAVQAGGPSADLYLEKPASDIEVATFLSDLATKLQEPRALAASR